MWILYSVLGLLGLLVIALSVPVFGRIAYDGELRIAVRVLGIPITILPKAEETPSPRSAAKSAKKKSKDKPSKAKELKELLRQDDLAGTLHFIRSAAALAGKAVGRLLRAITIRRLDLQLLIAAADPADTAQRYGQVCSILYPALAGIEQCMRVQHRNLRVEPNFLIEKSAVRFDVRLRVSVWRLLGAGVALLWGFLMIKEQRNPQIKKEVSDYE